MAFDLVTLIGSVLFAFGLGGLAAVALTEARHDCLPHDPKTCREETRTDGN